MKVTLRKRNQGGKTSLYLDYYNQGKRKTESLKLKEKTSWFLKVWNILPGTIPDETYIKEIKQKQQSLCCLLL